MASQQFVLTMGYLCPSLLGGYKFTTDAFQSRNKSLKRVLVFLYLSSRERPSWHMASLGYRQATLDTVSLLCFTFLLRPELQMMVDELKPQCVAW